MRTMMEHQQKIDYATTSSLFHDIKIQSSRNQKEERKKDYRNPEGIEIAITQSTLEKLFFRHTHSLFSLLILLSKIGKTKCHQRWLHAFIVQE